MTVFMLVFGLMLLLVGGMAIGVMFGRKPISGSCGGLGATGVTQGSCKLCGGDPNACDSGVGSDEPKSGHQNSKGESSFYDAS